MIVSSPAKLNVFLELMGKRPDGFHNLETVMLRTKFCDVMQFRCRSDSEIHILLSDESDAFDKDQFPLDDTNLIYRAATLLQHSAAIKTGADIIVTKRIPAQAGLAGGSSNAATTLRSLNELWHAGCSESELHAMASTLGTCFKISNAIVPWPAIIAGSSNPWT